eukprot:gene16665-biopygen6779
MRRRCASARMPRPVAGYEEITPKRTPPGVSCGAALQPLLARSDLRVAGGRGRTAHGGTTGAPRSCALGMEPDQRAEVLPRWGSQIPSGQFQRAPQFAHQKPQAGE